MQQLLSKTWLWLAILALLISIYVTLTDGFIFGKAYIFLLISGGSFFFFKFKSKGK
jgi:hypothetical protein